MSRALAGLMLASSCVVEHRIVVDGSALRNSVRPLRAHGEAVVDARDEHGDDSSRSRERIRSDQAIRVDGEPRLVRDLLVDCPDDPSVRDKRCALEPMAGIPLEVRRFESRNVATPVVASAWIVSIGAFTAAVACGIACADGTPKTASEITMGVVGAGVGVALIYTLVACVTGDRCRD
jgi:hypothetical protein